MWKKALECDYWWAFINAENSIQFGYFVKKKYPLPTNLGTKTCLTCVKL